MVSSLVVLELEQVLGGEVAFLLFQVVAEFDDHSFPDHSPIPLLCDVQVFPLQLFRLNSQHSQLINVDQFLSGKVLLKWIIKLLCK